MHEWVKLLWVRGNEIAEDSEKKGHREDTRRPQSPEANHRGHPTLSQGVDRGECIPGAPRRWKKSGTIM